MLTAETLYNVLQLQDDEIPEAERLISDTEWYIANKISTDITTLLICLPPPFPQVKV
jgi:hypothetical protein